MTVVPLPGPVFPPIRFPKFPGWPHMTPEEAAILGTRSALTFRTFWLNLPREVKMAITSRFFPNTQGVIWGIMYRELFFKGLLSKVRSPYELRVLANKKLVLLGWGAKAAKVRVAWTYLRSMGLAWKAFDDWYDPQAPRLDISPEAKGALQAFQIVRDYYDVVGGGFVKGMAYTDIDDMMDGWGDLLQFAFFDLDWATGQQLVTEGVVSDNPLLVAQGINIIWTDLSEHLFNAPNVLLSGWENQVAVWEDKPEMTRNVRLLAGVAGLLYNVVESGVGTATPRPPVIIPGQPADPGRHGPVDQPAPLTPEDEAALRKPPLDPTAPGPGIRVPRRVEGRQFKRFRLGPGGAYPPWLLDAIKKG